MNPYLKKNFYTLFSVNYDLTSIYTLYANFWTCQPWWSDTSYELINYYIYHRDTFF